jgi:hypothetical protein
MSEQNINISPQNIYGKCDLKCSYNFKYSESNSTATNNGVMISITYDNSSVSPVKYNNEQYNVSSIMIVSPSIHIFNKKKMPGEIIIEHIPVKGGNNLNVSIPFKLSNEITDASNLITEIINTVSTNAPSEGNTTNLNLSNFNLETIIPKKPYYVYTNANQDYIVFGDLQAIPLSLSTLEILGQIIKPFSLSTPGEYLFYNSKGPISGIQIGDGIYISCRPTGTSDEETAVTYNKELLNVNFSNILNNPILNTIIRVLIGCLILIILFYAINIFYNYLSSDAQKLPRLPQMRKLENVKLN